LCMGDHVSFHGGRGFDGLVHAAALAALCDLEIQTSIYLLPLRHPVPVARQVNSLSQLAPGRFIFGVGIGGEDPNELWMCGIDPSTRGKRMDEAMSLVRALLDGETVTRAGGFYPVADARIRPVPVSRVPIVVGGRSDAALRRAGRLGDGYLAVWVSAERFGRSTAQVEQHGADAGRSDVPWRHGLLVWCGIGKSATARGPLATAMEGLYQTSFEKFERWSPYGTPDDIAGFLRPYIDAGCHDFNLIAVSSTSAEAFAGVAEVRRLLLAS
jgi:alkanesulfonate monooxygenase SsuD/methylene tetrahydromethanopterin reductase-like flavin-dependent oxidoreductase (luciferase family)